MQVPGSPGSCHKQKNQSHGVHSARGIRAYCWEDNCCYTALCSQGWDNTRQEGREMLPLDHMQLEGSSSTSSMFQLWIDLCRMQLAQGETLPNNADTRWSKTTRTTETQRAEWHLDCTAYSAHPGGEFWIGFLASHLWTGLCDALPFTSPRGVMYLVTDFGLQLMEPGMLDTAMAGDTHWTPNQIKRKTSSREALQVALKWL